MKTKKIIAALLSSAMVLGTLAVPVFADSTGNWIDSVYTEWVGDGTKDNPYQISSAEELAGLAKVVNVNTVSTSGEKGADGMQDSSYKKNYFKLTADIDLAGKEWTPIGNGVGYFNEEEKIDHRNIFVGSFDGNGKKISNLKINAPSTDNVGLFGISDNLNNEGAAFKDLTIENVEITGQNAVGALAGGILRCTLSNIKVCGKIKIEGNYAVGGIIGSGHVNASDLTVEGTGNNNTIKGVNKENDLEGDNVGGIAGISGSAGNGHYSYDNLSVSNVNVTGTRKVGGVFGTIYSSNYVTNVNVSDVTVGTNATADYASKKSSKGLGGFAGIYVNDSINGGWLKGARISDVRFSVPNDLTGFGTGPVTGGLYGALEEPTLVTVSDVTVNCTGATNAFLVTKVTGGEYKVDVHKYLSAGLAEKEDNGTYTVIPLSKVVPNLTGVVTIKSAVEDKTYEQVSALVTNIQGNTKDFNVTTSGDEDTQNITNQKITLKDIGHYDGDVLCGLIIKNIPEGVTVTVTAAE